VTINFIKAGLSSREAADQLPKPFTSLEQAVNWLRVKEKLDGVFTDHPDLVLKCLL